MTYTSPSGPISYECVKYWANQLTSKPLDASLKQSSEIQREKRTKNLSYSDDI